ncbi:MAG: hypothetical protein ABI460_12850 [Caldimonas sp.]
MQATFSLEPSLLPMVRAALRHFTLVGVVLLVAACGGGGGGGGGGMPAGVAPTVTLQPANASVTAGQAASFVVAATGDAPLAYQWQRNGADIAGATSTTFSIAATVLGDSGATFRAVVTNASGSATSTAATLTVAPAAPVLTITAQPANLSVVAGASAGFTVAATCSSATLAIQWQRGDLVAAVLTWTDIAGATAATYTLATALADSGAQFRAQLSCSGMSAATSAVALLTVTAPPTAMLALLPVNGLRDHAEAGATSGIVQDASGSFTFLTVNRIKRLSADLSTITPVAGGGAPAAFADGPATTARFNAPLGLAQDPTGILYVADTGNHLIRKVALDGTVTTLAGSPGVAGFADGTGSAARFSSPWAITVGPDGDLYVADRNNNRIRRVTTAGVVTTYSGGAGGYQNGAASTAQFLFPEGVVAAPSGDLYVADYGNLRVRLISRSGSGAGTVSTFAGSGLNVPLQPDGAANVASIPFPSAIALRGNTLVVTDEAGLLRRVDLSSGAVSTLTGFRAPVTGQGYADGPIGVSRLSAVRGIAPMASGGYMVSDNNSLRTVSASGVVTTISTTAIGVAWTPTGVGVLAQEPIIMGSRQALSVDPAGNVVIADSSTHLVRRIAPSGAVTLAAGLSGNYAGPVDGKANEAQFVRLGPVASDAAGVLYVTDNYAVRRIGTDNVVSIVAGSYTEFASVNGNATTARFFDMNAIAVGPGGNIFVADGTTIRKVDTAGNVTTYAGAFFQAGMVDGPVATSRFQFPNTLAFAPDGALYVVDGSVIRRISADGATVSTTAANDVEGGLAIDTDGTIYYGSATGLAMISTGGTRTVLIPKGPATVLGASPALLNVLGIAVLGPKRLVIQTGFDLLIATLP